jgi:tRNA-dihydrouridine synthase
MEYYFAPMEGITTAIYRRVHAALFGGADRYYSPFISPTAEHLFTPRELRELGPENNRGIPLVPQVLTKNADDFLWAAAGLADMGYGEVNLNLGCPSATVTAKGKGSALLRSADALASFLDEIFARAEIPVSVKTRIGYWAPEEFPRLLEVFNRYPLAELILHCRTRQEMYAAAPHYEALELALRESRSPVCYNGSLFTPADCAAFTARWPRQRRVMLGRGAAADPAIFRRVKGGAAASREELETFHRELYAAYRAEYGALNGMRRMKELWNCLFDRFEGGEELRKKMMRTKDTGVFEECAATALGRLPLKDRE